VCEVLVSFSKKREQGGDERIKKGKKEEGVRNEGREGRAILS
jgi:hypothetical protein